MLEPAAEPELHTPSTSRLVIRVKLLSQEPPPPPARWRLSRSALLLILVVVAVPLCWLGINTFRPHAVASKQAPNDSSLAPLAAARTEHSRIVSDELLPKPATETPLINAAEGDARAVDAEVERQQDASPLSVHEEIPDVPRSALATIQGTVRVSVRVIVDSKGTVVAAIADDRGPSRYFERLSVEASKSWRFATVNSDEQRIMLVRFRFTRAGATAHASPLQ